MIKNKVIAKHKNGQLVKGQTSNFSPNKISFHVENSNGELMEIKLEDLKSVYFVKDLDGNKDHRKKYGDTVAGGGRKIKVVYQDGEEIIGYTQGYSPERQGFIMIPADLTGNNERIYVVKSATKEIKYV